MRTLGLLFSVCVMGCSQDITVKDEANVAPAASINAPADQSVFTDLDTIEFLGTVADGNGLADIATVTWTSSIDGEFPHQGPDTDGVTRAPTSLSVGQHTITLTVIDGDGDSDADSRTIIVQEADQTPFAEIALPVNLESHVIGQDVALQGDVGDPNQSADTLSVTWEVGLVNQPLTLVYSGAPNAAGETNAVWEDIPGLGQWRVVLTVTDDDGNTDMDEAIVLVTDSLDADLDGDGWSPNQGDCDDYDATRHPNAVEICGNSIDEDCNGILDDKDEDSDAHIDEACDGTYNGPFPSDDCNDANASVFPGATEVIDGVDNNCNGLSDEGTNAWDADGDCYCPGTTCTGSVNPQCTTVSPSDCNDNDPDNFPNNPEICDNADNDCDGLVDDGLAGTNYWPDADGDGFGNASSLPTNSCGTPPTNHVNNNTDCNDGNAAINPNAGEITCDTVDNDCSLATPDAPDGDGDGVSVCIDCNDADATNFPNNPEVCDGADNDCDNLIDEGVQYTTYWEDADGDGFGAIAGQTQLSCSGPPSGYVAEHTDCDDTNALMNPGQTEIQCDGLENDCNTATRDQPDADNDGVSVCTDCDDADPLNFPGNTEFCDGQDNNCNTTVDDGVTFTNFWPDLDGDLRGNASASPVNACSPPASHVNNSNDCDDADPDNYLGNTEVCDGADNDCDGTPDDGIPFQNWYVDLDGDTFGSSSIAPTSTCNGAPGPNYADRGGDCNDVSPTVNPVAVEVECDGVDNDCNGQTEDEPDEDGDLYSVCDDCDDGDPDNFPNNPEVCDGADNDCDAVADDGLTFVAYYLDLDSDGYGNIFSPATNTCSGPPSGMVADNTDCNDSNTSVNPGEIEVNCDVVDNDCNAATPDAPDGDSDGWSMCVDCDDADPDNFPGNPEVCDGADNNCTGTADDGLAFVNYWPDADNDGAGDPNLAPVSTCNGAPVGRVNDNSDCDDGDPDNFPGNPEVCDGADNDCDTVADDGLTFTDYWPDGDNDGYGSDAVAPTSTCSGAPAASGWATQAGDCDDGTGLINPGRAEIVADGIDQDCDDVDDCYEDVDNDGRGVATVVTGDTLDCSNNFESPFADDCDDADPFNFPGNIESCDGQDNDCSGQPEQAGEVTFANYWPDVDGDGYGNALAAAENACSPPSGKVANNGDCNDGNVNVNPGENEATCNGLDDDCDALTLDQPDGDGDGDPVCTDCNDANASNSSIGAEVCDGADNDCNGVADNGLTFVNYWRDADNDQSGSSVLAPVSTCDGAPSGYVPNNDDCDDFDASLNGRDDDNDGYSTCDDDCDDGAFGTNPGIPNDVPDDAFTDEDCDGIDGHAADAVFVSTTGSDLSLVCTRLSPCRTIDYAMSVAEGLGLTEVYIRAGSYTGGVMLLDGMNLYGGYDASWVRDLNTISAHNVTISGGYESTVTEYLTVWADTVSAGLYDLEINGPTAFGTESGAGRSSYAIYADNSTLDIARVVVDQGNGASGTTATNGSSASQSAPGSAVGGGGGDAEYHLLCSTSRVSGGAGGTNASCPNTTGGSGGSSGQSDHTCPFLGFGDPTAGINGVSGNQWSTNGPGYRGAGGPVCEDSCTADNGGDGNDGRITNGSKGNAADERGWITGGFWYGFTGGNGGTGSAGGGGGGGGGGAGEDNGASDNDTGAGGGGGGAGGCAATAGTGGGAGGSSWGVFAYQSTVVVSDSVFNRGNGGAGRNGGTGGAGQPGGVGGLGGNSPWDSGDGGDGGNGGHGGHGGGGAGGAGGHSYGFFSYQSTITRPGTVVSGGAVGTSGTGGVSAASWPDGNNGDPGEAGLIGTQFTCSGAFGC